MAGSLFVHLVRRSFELPFRVVLRKAWGLVGRSARAWLLARRDSWCSTYSVRDTEFVGIELALQLDSVNIPATTLADLIECTEHYFDHEFDLLGTGWRCADYGAPVAGLEGIHFDARPDIMAIARSRDPCVLVSRANRRTAHRIYQLIDDPTYRPIDWQRDGRSGFRWSNRASFLALGVGAVRGADIKLPWELSRLQHLPQLALAALLSHQGVKGLRSPAVYAQEIRKQCLDFIATNPPRHGACWGCPMDVGIRAANIVLAHAIVQRTGLTFDDAYRCQLGNSLAEHGAHVAQHIEWSESGRSNHFLSDLLGLMFCAAALPSSAQTRAWMDYATSWLLHDTLVQFHVDGGNYEGSTSYHRLSAELVLYGMALVRGKLAREPDYLMALERGSLSTIRGGIAPGIGAADLLDQVGARLAAMHRFCRVAQGPDDIISQIGDTDSGRLFKLSPRLARTQASAQKAGDGSHSGANTARDCPLDGAEAMAGLAALLGVAHGQAPHSPAASLVTALAHGNLWSAQDAVDIAILPEDPLAELLDEAQTLADAARRCLDITIPGLEPEALELAFFAEFGLLSARADEFRLLLRCAAHRREDAPTGHLHDDNLGLEVHAGGQSIVRDPGTYVYTPLPESRNAYREAQAHFAPRAQQWSAVQYSDYLFESFQCASARCLHASTQGLAVRLEAQMGYVQRIVLFLPGSIRIVDSCAPGALRNLSPPVKCCSGYGIRTPRPSHPF